VGLSHFVEAVNTRIFVFNKTTCAQITSFSLQALFGVSEFVFDPRVLYDQTWTRFIIIASRQSTSINDTVRRFFLAVSQTSNPAGPYFTYNVTFGGGPFNNGDWWDFPQLGYNQDAVLVTGNVFDNPPTDTVAAVFKFAAMMPIAKARIYNGLSFSAPVFTNLAATLAPPIVRDQNNSAFFLAANNFTHLHLYRGNNLSNPASTTLVLQALVTVSNYAIPPNAPQPNSNQVLDTSDRRFVNASTQVGDSLWNVHTIRLGGFAAPKFYEIDTTGPGANIVKQQGFFFEGGTSHDFNASIAANDLREAFVTWNSTDVTNSNVSLRHNARIRISGCQLPCSIPAGSIVFTSGVALTGNPADPPPFNVQRWGDYSAVSLDPSVVSGCSANRRAYIVNEKINSASLWGSRFARIGFCG
jgi:hypothetical protein